jgi:hypothetical protein
MSEVAGRPEMNLSGRPKAYTCAKELMTMSAMASDTHEGTSAFLENCQRIWTDLER